MAAVVWVVVAVVALVAVGLLVRRSQYRQRTERLRQRFGPEYRRVLHERRSRRHAEAELSDRERRHAALDIRPLTAASRERYADAWGDTQRRFVDDPVGAVTMGDRMISLLMEERGYPTEDFDQRVADLSVEHGQVLDNYRTARDIAERSGRNAATTEELRRAMLLYRSLFDDLLGVAHVTPVGAQQQPEEAPSPTPAARS